MEERKKEEWERKRKMGRKMPGGRDKKLLLQLLLLNVGKLIPKGLLSMLGNRMKNGRNCKN